MTVLVKFMYPVYAEVDLDSRNVLRVVVDDESPAGTVEVLDDDLAPADDATRAGAISIVQEASWPGWTYGW
jgi:hypothetical protein